MAAAIATAPARAAVPANDNPGQRSGISYRGEGKFSGLDQLVPGNIHNAELEMTFAAARWNFQRCPVDADAREVAIQSVVDLAFVAAEKAGEADRWDRDEELQRVAEMYDGAVAKYSHKWATGTSADDVGTGTWETVTILDDVPERMTRPLSLVNGRGYAACWVPLQTERTAKVDRSSSSIQQLDKPEFETNIGLVFVDDQGQLFADVSIAGALPVSEIGIDISVREKPLSENIWSGRGLREFVSGTRPDPKDVFERVVAAIDSFIDFSRSMADQNTMCEMAACYVMASYGLDAFNVTGYLWPNGQRGAGKTHFLHVLSRMTYLGKVTTTGSTFASLRDLADYGACLAFDDCEDIANPKSGDPYKRDLLLAGNRRGMQIAFKEPDGKNGWATKTVDAFSPRLFSAINLPDPVLGSRTITVPLIRSDDKSRSNSDPLDDDAWPVDRSVLVDDLWAFGLTNLPQLKAMDRKVPQNTNLHGRQLEPWRTIFAVALYLQQEHGVEGLFGRISDLANVNQQEREELEADDPPRLLVFALWQVLDGREKATIETQLIVETLNSVADEVGVRVPGEDYMNAGKTGKLLGSLRFRQAPKGKSKRKWTILKEDVERTAQTHGITLSGTSAESAGSGDLPVESGVITGTSAGSAHAALGLEVDSLADDFVDM